MKLAAIFIIAVTLTSLMSMDGQLFIKRRFYFDKTASQSQLEQLQLEMKKSGIQTEFKKVVYDEQGNIKHIEMHMNSFGAFTRFCTDTFESAEITKKAFKISVIINNERESEF